MDGIEIESRVVVTIKTVETANWKRSQSSGAKWLRKAHSIRQRQCCR